MLSCNLLGIFFEDINITVIVNFNFFGYCFAQVACQFLLCVMISIGASSLFLSCYQIVIGLTPSNFSTNF